MFTFRRFLSRALLLSLLGLASCTPFFGGGSGSQREARGGFTVRVDGAGLPAAARAVADVGAFAQGRGFVRQAVKAAPPADPANHEPRPVAPQRYLLGNLVLEISHQSADHRVTAYLYGSAPGRERGFIDRFYRDFAREYAGRYGGEDRISQSAYAEASGNPSGPLGTLEPGGVPEGGSPLNTGIPPVSGAPGGSSAPVGLPTY